MQAFTIRRGIEDDAASIARLAGELGYSTAVEEMRARIKAVFRSSADLLIVATATSGAPVGWLHAHSSQPIESEFRVEIVGLIVTPTARCAGIGRALVGEAEQWAASIGASIIVVRSNITRSESHVFYPALGYTETKMQRVYRKDLTSNRNAR